MPNDTVSAGQRINICQWIPALIRRWSRVRDQRATNVTDFFGGYQVTVGRRGWCKVWRRVDAALLFVRRLAIWLAAGIFVFAPLRPGWGIYIH